MNTGNAGSAWLDRRPDEERQPSDSRHHPAEPHRQVEDLPPLGHAGLLTTLLLPPVVVDIDHEILPELVPEDRQREQGENPDRELHHVDHQVGEGTGKQGQAENDNGHDRPPELLSPPKTGCQKALDYTPQRQQYRTRVNPHFRKQFHRSLHFCATSDPSTWDSKVTLLYKA